VPMITKSHLATTAPTVTLLLSFAAVFLLGQVLAPWLGPAEAPAGPATPTAIAPKTPASDSVGVTGVVEDQGNRQYSFGAVQSHEQFAKSRFSPKVLDGKDGMLDACITVPDGYWLPDGDPDPHKGWEARDLPEGEYYCTTVPPGTIVTFTLVKKK
jgi:hypothetical protein